MMRSNEAAEATCRFQSAHVGSVPKVRVRMQLPKRLYKYRSFGVKSLRMITESEIYFALPKSFNDPLDCVASLDPDVERLWLERILYQLLLRTGSEDKAKQAISHNRYMSTEYGNYKTDKSVDEGLARNTAYQVECELNRQLGAHGVLAFSETWRSVLMWSHYGDEHRGFCFEYETAEMPHLTLAPVRYGGARQIKASDLYNWLLKKDEAARLCVYQTYFFSKSGEWKYEKEWREVIAKPGVNDTEYGLTAIHFGMRCDRAVVASVVKLLNEREDIKLYHVHPHANSFRLTRSLVDRDEINALAIRDPGFRMFPKLTDGELTDHFGDEEATLAPPPSV